jgi:hypothetical protein
MPLTALLLQYSSVAGCNLYAGEKRPLASARPLDPDSDCVFTSGNCPVDSVAKPLGGYWRTGVISTSVAVRLDEGVRYLIVSCHGVGMLGEERGVNSQAIADVVESIAHNNLMQVTSRIGSTREQCTIEILIQSHECLSSTCAATSRYRQRIGKPCS